MGETTERTGRRSPARGMNPRAPGAEEGANRTTRIEGGRSRDRRARRPTRRVEGGGSEPQGRENMKLRLTALLCIALCACVAAAAASAGKVTPSISLDQVTSGTGALV